MRRHPPAAGQCAFITRILVTMKMALYSDLVPWYHLVDPAEDHLEEADAFEAAFTHGAVVPPATLLELGSGAGHNALHMKRRFQCTLTDLSPQMLARSQGLNPECEHLPGDMRTLRLGRTFDTVLVHDAIVYMTSEEDLLAAARTAFVHTAPGGRAVFAPDCVRETFRETSEVISGDDGTRAMRCVAWTWDPDPRDSSSTWSSPSCCVRGRPSLPSTTGTSRDSSHAHRGSACWPAPASRSQ